MKNKIVPGIALGLLMAASAVAQQIIYVNQAAPLTSTQDGSSWTNAYREARDALNSPNLHPSAANPVQIWVAQGTYKPTADTNRFASFTLKSYLAILGGFVGTESSPASRSASPPLTVLSGDIGVPQIQAVNNKTTDFNSVPINYADPGTRDNSYNVLTCVGVSNAVLDTLVVTGGYAFRDQNDTNLTELDIEGMIAAPYQDPNNTNGPFNGAPMIAPTNTLIGGGLYVQNSHYRPDSEVALLIQNCQFVNNTTEGYGGGIGGIEATLEFVATKFINNQAGREGGAVWALNGLASYANCSFLSNSAVRWGGAVMNRTLPSDRTTFDTSANGGFSLPYALDLSSQAQSAMENGAEVDEGVNIFESVEDDPDTIIESPATEVEEPGGIWSAFKSGYAQGNGFKGGVTEGLRSATSAFSAASKITLGMKVMGDVGELWNAAQVLDQFGELGFDLAAAFGADTNSAAARGWETFDNNFNLYATPSGWAQLLAGPLGDLLGGTGPTFAEQAQAIKQAELGLYNQDTDYTSMLNCTFSGNISASGGALCLIFQNVHVEDCTFSQNLAENGGAVLSSSYNTPFFISCVFDLNHATLGHSAIANLSHSRAQIVNCSFVNNGSDPTNGFAIGVETGSEVQLANSILWGNTNSDPANAAGGADLFVATQATLGTNSLFAAQTDTNSAPAYTNALQAYAAAGPAYGDWIGECEITHSCVQSLNRLPVGTENFLEFNGVSESVVGVPVTEQIAEIEANFATANDAGTLAEYGFVNIGEGIRPGFITAANANIAQDPQFSGEFIPAYNSATVDAGNNARLNNGIVDAYTDIDVLGNLRLRGPALDMGAVEYQGYSTNTVSGVVYVDASATGDASGRDWSDAMTNLQAALNLPNSQVWVRAGTYYPTAGADRNASFVITNHNQVLGGFRGGEISPDQRLLGQFPTILSGNIGNPNVDSDNSYTVVVCQGDRNTVLDGLTITKGRGQYGGGLNGFGATILNCSFIDNSATVSGGAINGTDFLLRNCSFSENFAPGGGAIEASGLTAENCAFQGNSSGSGGAIFLQPPNPATFYNCLFASNSVSGTDNAAGGAVFADDVACGFYNCTFADNSMAVNSSATVGGAGLEAANGAALTAQNCIFWNNQVNNRSGLDASTEQQQLHLSGAASISLLSHDLIQGLNAYASMGVSNIGNDPAFQNPIEGNYQLSAYSPAIDAGWGSLPSDFPSVDLVGEPRVANRAIDLGAYEYQQAPTPLGTALGVTSTCDGNGNIYALQLLTNAALTNYSWQINRNDGQGFVALTDDSIHSGSTTPVLTVTHPSPAMRGYQYELQAGPFLSQAFTLRVSGPVVYVNAAAHGGNNGASWTDAFTSLTSALAAAAPCSQIWVAQGVYYPANFGSGNQTAAFQLAQGVSVYGGFAGMETALSQRNWQSNVSTLSGCIASLGRFDPLYDSLHIISNDGSNPAAPVDSSAVLDGFTLFGATEGSVLNLDASPAFANCVFIDNESGAASIVNNGSSSPTFSNCAFARAPLQVCPSSGATFVLTNTSGPVAGYQWQVDGGSGFAAISTGGNFTVSATSNSLTLTLATVTANGASYRFAIPAAGYVSPGVVFTLLPPSVSYVNASVVGGAKNGTSWANAYTDLAAALSNATSCVQVWVAAGRYSDASAGGFFSLQPGVALYGGFAGGETTLAQRNPVLNPTYLAQVSNYSVIYNDGTRSLAAIDSSAVLDGFAFAGNAQSPVIYNLDASPTIRNCAFISNGYYSVFNDNSRPAIIDCAFRNNAQVAVYNRNSDATLISNVFFGQRNIGGNGACIVNDSANAMIENCSFTNNVAGWGAAIESQGSSRPTILDCIFSQNSANVGGAIDDGGAVQATIRNCLFVKNSSATFRGGAIADAAASLALINCTFAGNQAAFSGAGLFSQSPVVLITNCIFWNNSLSTYLYAGVEQAQIDAPPAGLQLAYSIVQGLATLPGKNNLPYDPLFADESTGNYRLGFFSPAANAGWTTGLDATDLDGNPRVFGGAVDIGAYELEAPAQPAVYLLATPLAQSVCAGSAVSFTAAAPAGSNSTFLWFTNAGNGSYYPIFTGGAVTISTSNNTSALSIAATALSQNGLSVEVEVSNYVSEPATLQVVAPSVVYVSRNATGTGDGSSWANAFTNFTSALNTAPDCSQMWVAGETYAVAGAQLRNGIGIYGGFAGGETSLAQRNWTNHPVTLAGAANQYIFDNEGGQNPIDATAVLDGFTLTGGGNGFLFNATASPTIRNCLFTGATGPAAQNSGQSSPAFINDRFIANANGAMLNENSTALVTNCLFQSNNAVTIPGGAIESDSSTITIIDSQFLNNSSQEGGAIDSRNGATLVSRCLFENNSAPGGGALSLWDGSSQVLNCLLANNSATEYGAAMDLYKNSTVVRNCTIAQNSTPNGNVGGIFAEAGNLSVVNSILWNNFDRTSSTATEMGQLAALEGATIAVSNTCVSGLSQFAGHFNLGIDPLFSNPAGSDFTLSLYSPGVDAGNTALATPDVYDLNHQPRVVGPAVDDGAYESSHPSPGAVAFVSAPQSQSVCAGANAVFTLVNASNAAGTVVWTENSGGGAVAVHNDGAHLILQSNNTSILIVSNVIAGMNGWTYQFSLPTVSPFVSPVLTLTVTAPEILYVNSAARGAQTGLSWTDAFTNLPAALAAAGSCSEVWVTRGVYSPALDSSGRTSFTLNPGVQIFGGFTGKETSLTQRNWLTNATVLLGTPFDSVIHCDESGVGRFTLLDGFTITGTNGQIGLDSTSAGPTVRHCAFIANSGWAIFNWSGGNPLIDTCVFSNNSQAAVYSGYSSIQATNCAFVSNLAGAIYNYESIAAISNCDFTANSTPGNGGAIFDLSSTDTVVYCVFARNSGVSGGALSSEGSTLSLLNCLLDGNSCVGSGGAVMNIASTQTIVNCTITGNSASDGGGLGQYSGSDLIYNTILWNNTDTDSRDPLDRQFIRPGGSQTILASDIEGWPGSLPDPNLNFNLDPLFNNPAQNDYTLQGYSPAIGAGQYIYAAGLPVDLAGNPRTVGFRVDLGAYTALQDFGAADIVSQPTSQSACPGGAVTFTVVGIASGWEFFNPTNAIWQDLPSSPATNFPFTYSIGFTSNSLSVNLTGVTTNMNGFQFRPNYTPYTGFLGQPVTLTILPPSIIYVNASAGSSGDGTSWAGAYNSLAAAVAASSPCRPEIWVAGGVYGTPSGGFNVPAGVALFGGFAGTETNRNQRNWNANATILDAGGASINMINFNPPVDTNTVLDGFTIQNANGLALTAYESSPTIRNCLVRRVAGTALFVESGNPVVSNCRFESNSAAYGSPAVITSYGGSPLIVNCAISGNLGGGIQCFLGNGNDLTDNPYIVNCLISGNAGTGINFEQGDGSIINCTISANLGGIMVADGQYNIFNCVIWNNRSGIAGLTVLNDQLYDGEALVFLYNSCVEQFNPSALGELISYVYYGANTMGDPAFVNPIWPGAVTASGDFHLQPCSSAINQGDNGSVGGFATDLDGTPRVQDGVVDMGAYEFAGTNLSAPIAFTLQPAPITYCPLNPNQFSVGASTNAVAFQWQVDQGSGFSSISDNAIYSGSGSAVLNISNAVPSMNGYQYRCVAANSSGCAVYSAEAALVVPPSSRWYVNAAAVAGGNGLSWSSAFTNVQQALANPNLYVCGAEIWVAAGHYPDAISLLDGVHILGGFKGTETASGQRNWTANPTILTGSGPVVVANNNDATAELDGFIIQGASLGVSIAGGVPQLFNCAFRSNTQAVSLSGSQAALQNCVFTNNGAGGVLGACLRLNQSSPFIQQCVFSGNMASSGGAIYSGGQSAGTVANSLFSGNAATNPGAAIFVAADGSQLSMNNCTVTGNGSPVTPAGGGSVNANNCVFWNNTGALFGSVNFNNSSQTDPQFLVPLLSSSSPSSAGNFHVAACSPVINAGNNNLAVGGLDLDGNPRIVDGSVDLGAYEYQQISLHVTISPALATGSFGTPVQFVAQPNQTNAAFTYQWMVSPNGAGFVTLQNGPNYMGATTPVLTISNANPALNNDQYLCVVQNGSCMASSPSATYSNVTTLASGFSNSNGRITFNLPASAVASSALDQTIAVYPMETGRLRLANGSLAAITVTNSTVTLNPARAFKPGEPVSVTATAGLQMAGGYGVQPYVWQFRAPVNSSANRAFLVKGSALGGGNDIAGGDVNGDGAIDLLAASSAGAMVWTNTGHGQFSNSGPAIAGSCVAVALADVDGDGDLDAITVRADGTIHIALNNGSGVFSDSGQSLGASNQTVAIGDVNGDGYLDIIGAGAGPMRVFLNDGTGRFVDSGQRLNDSSAGSMALADLNGDGILDAVVANRGGQPSKIWLNDGLGNFTDSGQLLGSGDAAKVVLGDLNGDGSVDIIIANDDSPSTVWTNNGAGVFTQLLTSNHALHPNDSIVSVYGDDLRSPTNFLDGNPSTYYQIDSGSAEFIITPSAGPTLATSVTLTSSPHAFSAPGIFYLWGTKTDGATVELGQYEISFAAPGASVTVPLTNTAVVTNYTLFLAVNNPQNFDMELAEFQMSRTDVPVLGGATTAMALGDIDGNGTLDVVLGRADGSREIWLNDGAGHFTRDSRQLASGSQGPLVLADLDGDGDLDLAQSAGVGGTNSVASLQLADARGNELASIAIPAAAFLNKFSNLGIGALTQVKILTLPSGGALLLNSAAVQVNQQIPAGSLANLIYQGNAGFDGMDAFTWTGASSGGYATNTLPLYVLTQNVPQGPTAVDDTLLVNQGGTSRILTNGASSVLANDFDTSGQPLTGAELISGPSHGTVVFNFDGTFAYTHDGSETLTDAFTYRVWDATGASSAATAHVVVTNISLPVANGQSVTNVEDVPFNITLSGSSSRGQTLTYNVAQAPAHGTLSGNPPNLTYTPTLYYSGTDSFAFVANDGQLDSAPGVVAITLTHVNHPPIANAQSITNAEDGPFGITLSGLDVDGNSLSFTVTAPPAHGSLSGTPPNLVYTPVLYYVGPDSFAFEASDSHTNSVPAGVSIVLTRINHAPVGIGQSLTRPEDSPFGVTLAATDVDGDALSYSVVTAPLHGSLSGTPPNLVYSPTLYYVGADSFTFAANDGKTNSGLATVSMNLTRINHAPLTTNQLLNIPENTAANITLLATDLEGNPITFSVARNPAHGSLSGLAPNLVYLPNASFLGTDSFVYAVADNQGDTNTGTMTLAVLNFNLTVTNTLDAGPGTLRAAMASASLVPSTFAWVIGFSPTLAGQTIKLSTQASDGMGPSALVVSNINIAINGAAAPGLGIARDSAAQPMRLFHVLAGAGLIVSNVTLSGGASFGQSGAPGNGAGGGGLGAGGAIYNEGTLTINHATLTDHLAVGGGGGSGGESEDQGGNGGGLNAGVAGAFFGDFGRPGGFGGGGGGAGRANGLGLGGAGGFGGGNGGGLNSSEANGGAGGFGGGGGGGSFADGGGGLGAGGAIFNNGGVVNIQNSILTANLADGGPANADAQQGSGLGDTLFNRNGTVNILNCSFTNNGAYHVGGIFNLGDGATGTVAMEGVNFGIFLGTNVVTAAINQGTAISTPPLQLSATVFRGQSVVIPVASLGSGNSITAVQPGRFGTATFAGTNLTYHENGANQSSDTFNYIMTGPNGLPSAGVVAVAIVFTNRPPVANNDYATTYGDLPVTIPVLANDSDPDGDPLNVVNVSNPASGSVTATPTNITYRSSNPSAANDSFTYAISDGQGGTATATVFITIAPPVVPVTTAADLGPGSLRAAIDLIQSVSTVDSWEVSISSNLAGQTLKLTTAEGSDPTGNSALVVNVPMVIDGSAAPGFTVTRDSNAALMRLFWISADGDLTVSHLTLSNGFAQGAAGNPNDVPTPGLGGAIYNGGFCTIDTVRLTANTAQGGAGATGQDGAMGGGGAVYSALAPQTTILDCQMDHNKAVGGAAGGANNAAGQGWGGAVLNGDSEVVIQSSVIVSNTADAGDGVFNLAAGDGSESFVEITGSMLSGLAGETNLFMFPEDGGQVYLVGRSNTVAVSDVPILSDIPDQTQSGPFSVNFSFTLPPGFSSEYQVLSLSEDESFIPSANLLVSGSGLTRTLSVTPGGQYGQGTVDVIVTDGSTYVGTFFNITLVPASFILSSFGMTNHHFQFQFTSAFGQSYEIQTSTNLVNWLPLQTVAATNSSTLFIDTLSPGSSRRFYRIESLSPSP